MKLTKTELTDLHDVIEDGTQNKPNPFNTTDKRRLVEKITLTTYNQLQDARKYRYMYLKLKENFEETIERLNEAHQRKIKLHEENEELKEQIKKEREIFAKLTNAHI
jgi:RNase adaptor protein for sRNA GlmZ degradation